jgi:hypothetical protein
MRSGNPDWHVTAKVVQEAHQPIRRKPVEATIDDRRHFRLIQAKRGGGLCLSQPALFNRVAGMEGKVCLIHQITRIGKAKVSEDVSAAFDGGTSVVINHSYRFLSSYLASATDVGQQFILTP